MPWGVVRLTIIEPSGVNTRVLGAGTGCYNCLISTHYHITISSQKLTGPRGDCIGVVSNDGTVEGSLTGLGAGSSTKDLESSREDLIDDCEMNEEDEAPEGDRTIDTEDSVENDDMLVGVSTSDDEDTDDGNKGTGVSGASGDGGNNEVDGVGVSGIVLKRSAEDIADPLGLKKDVSNDVSGPSGIARDLTEGEGSN